MLGTLLKRTIDNSRELGVIQSHEGVLGFSSRGFRGIAVRCEEHEPRTGVVPEALKEPVALPVLFGGAYLVLDHECEPGPGDYDVRTRILALYLGSAGHVANVGRDPVVANFREHGL